MCSLGRGRGMQRRFSGFGASIVVLASVFVGTSWMTSASAEKAPTVEAHPRTGVLVGKVTWCVPPAPWFTTTTTTSTSTTTPEPTTSVVTGTDTTTTTLPSIETRVLLPPPFGLVMLRKGQRVVVQSWMLGFTFVFADPTAPDPIIGMVEIYARFALRAPPGTYIWSAYGEHRRVELYAGRTTHLLVAVTTC